jgi:hypothetical protein
MLGAASARADAHSKRKMVLAVWSSPASQVTAAPMARNA